MADPAARLDPFGLAFGPYIAERLGVVHRALAAAEIDAFDRDAWALSRPGAELLHDLRPEGNLGNAVSELVALAHAGFLFWQQGERVASLTRDVLEGLREGPAPGVWAEGARTAYYLQAPPHRIWGAPIAEGPPEPLDGWFVVADEGRLQVVGVFGLLPDRPGFTVAHADGPPPGALVRNDGSPVFSPTLTGGAAAGLWSLVGHEELLELGWRTHRWVMASGGPPPQEAPR